MAQDLTNNSINDIYSTFLHISANTLTSTPQRVFDGLGNLSQLFVSTLGVGLSGTVTINNVAYPTLPGTVNQVPVVNTSGSLEFKNIQDILTSTGLSNLINATYSSPSIVVENGVIKELKNNISVKTFYMRRTSPTNQDIINTVVWANPVVDDIAHVHNLQGNTVYKLTYTSLGWQITQTI
jgi:hypothetical protein